MSHRCDTVTNAVMMQYSRDFKGHLASLFLNENVSLGKKYVFDIRRTSKEAYEQARRALYRAGVADLMPSDRSPGHGPDGCSGCPQSSALLEKLERLREALLCMLCCEGDIDATFCPCGHMVCCQNCATQLQVVVESYHGVVAWGKPFNPYYLRGVCDCIYGQNFVLL